MRLLLDTHALLWWRDASPKLSVRAQAEIANFANDILISAATLWEIVVKRGVGKLRFADDLQQVIQEETFQLLPIEFAHLRELESLPRLHRDPFDRILIAQAMAEQIPLVTNDRFAQGYAVQTFW